MSLYVWGANKSKQLNNQKVLHCYSPVYIPGTCGDNVPIAISAGESHTIVLCESGDIYTFGRGREGQLGHSAAEGTEAHLVPGLEEETVIDVSAGSMTSYAVTTTGNVYHWGLVHRPMRDAQVADGVHNAAQSGQLHGIAQDQDIYIEADMETRNMEWEAAENEDMYPTGSVNNHPNASRQLRDIVRDSAERWQLPTPEADREYVEELRAMGLTPQEIKVRMNDRIAQYKVMLTVGCTRTPLYTPQRVPHLDHIRVKAVAAGYAHVMLVSDEGFLYGAGYNDRGQLGLGHRINTSEFRQLDFLSNKFVVQVACGQQHAICRAVDRAAAEQSAEAVLVGSNCGADAYVWGNGTLGQLGLGMKGSTKGRLFPTLNMSLHASFPSGIVSVSAGANFTAVVTNDGLVFSFGHAEYNQHGGRANAHNDYVEAQYYFVPRRVEIRKLKVPLGAAQKSLSAVKKPSTQEYEDVHITNVSCGSAFTVAVDTKGDVYSWGWNESGVLGHGVRHFGTSPQRIESIGASFDGCKVRAIAAGSKHVVALTDAQGHAWASSFHSILESDKHVDCVIDIEGSVNALAAKFAAGKLSHLPSTSARSGAFFPCHRAILSARSTFLRGYINAALTSSQNESQDNSTEVLHITLPSAHANAVTVKSLLDYLYMDRVQVPAHKRAELAQLAGDLRIDRLEEILSEVQISMEVLSRSVPSCFTVNMTALFNSPAHCDIVFVVPKNRENTKMLTEEGHEYDTEKVFDASEHDFVRYAHRVVVGSRLPYFEALLSGGFAESRNRVSISAPFGGPTSHAVQVDISGLLLDGIELPTFEMVLLYAYTGQFHTTEYEEVDLNAIMAILVAANRLGFTSLTQQCERVLSLHLGHYFPFNAQNCLDFAVAYNIPRLERQCREILQKAPVSSVSGQKQG